MVRIYDRGQGQGDTSATCAGRAGLMARLFSSTLRPLALTDTSTLLHSYEPWLSVLPQRIQECQNAFPITFDAPTVESARLSGRVNCLRRVSLLRQQVCSSVMARWHVACQSSIGSTTRPLKLLRQAWRATR